jgi:hypothetical protein
MLTFVIRATAALLAVGATLVIVGTFDSFLGWDIFSKRLESVLYGVFFSSLALAAVGIALCFVLGIHELTELLRASLQGGEPPARRAMRHYGRLAVLGVAVLAAAIVALELVDRGVQVRRREEFKRLAREETGKFAPKLAPELPEDRAAPVLSDRLALLVDTLDNLDFVGDATLYLADPTDADVLWRYTPGWTRDGTARFERIFATRSGERAVRKALDGDPAPLGVENGKPSFEWLAPVGSAERPEAVVLVTADESQNFRVFSGSP